MLLQRRDRSRGGLQFRDTERLKRLDHRRIVGVGIEAEEAEGYVAGVKSAMMKPFSSMGLRLSSMVRCAGGVAPTPRNADGHSMSPVPSGPDKTVTMGFLLKSSRAAALHAAFGNGVKIAADDQRNPPRHGRHRRHQPVMLRSAIPAANRAWLLASSACRRAQNIGIPFTPFARAPARRIGGDIDDRCATSFAAMRALSQLSTVPSRKTAVGPAKVRVRRMS